MLAALIIVLVFFKRNVFDDRVADAIVSSKEVIHTLDVSDPTMQMIGYEPYWESIFLLEDGGLSAVSKPLKV